MVCGILGTIKLISGNYLVVATHREFVGVLNNHVIWRLAGYDIIPYVQSSIHMSDVQVCFHQKSDSEQEKSVIENKFYMFPNRESRMKHIYRC